MAAETDEPRNPLDSLKSHPEVRLLPRLSATEVAELGARLAIKPSEDVELLLGYASGFEAQSVDRVDFTGRSFTFHFSELTPSGIAIAKSVEGNFWVVDPSPGGSWDRILYFSHDPPVVVIAFLSLGMFIDEALTGQHLPKGATELARRVWQELPRGLMTSEVDSGADPLIVEFSRKLGPEFAIFDLRNSGVGRGFVWGGARPDADCARMGTELVFAVRQPQAPRSWFGRIFGR